MFDPNKPRILVALGGRSQEREVSIASGREVVSALEDLGYQTAVLDTGTGKLMQTPELDRLEKNPEKLPEVVNLPLVDIKRHSQLVFIALHGKFGEDGGFQALLDDIGVKYTGSGPLSSALAMNKKISKKIFAAYSVPTLPFEVIASVKRPKIKFPLVVKPNNQGSSVGVSVCENEADFALGAKRALSYSDEIIVEPYVTGHELTVAILENEKGEAKALPVVEIIPLPDGRHGKTKFFDFEAKYDGTTQEIVPAKIESRLSREAQTAALKAYEALDCRHFARVDIIVGADKFPKVLEVNTIPGLTKESLFPKAAKAAGLDFNALVDHLVKIAIS